jgi:multimeric flavodoxin WrbA
MIIHDLYQEQAEKVLANVEDTCVISDNHTIRNCIGCFGCWVKTPGQCVIKDGYENMGALLGRTKELIIISKMNYGGFSPFVKNVMDRSISYIHPYFQIRNKEMHHRRRYDNVIRIRVLFYGENISQEEKNTANGYIEAVCVNLDARLEEIRFVTIKELTEGDLC